MAKTAARKTYETNLRLLNVETPEFRTTDIIPSVKKVLATGGETVLEKQLSLTFHEDFANEGKLLKEKLTAWYGLEVVSEAPVTIVMDYLSDRKRQSMRNIMNCALTVSRSGLVPLLHMEFLMVHRLC